MNILQSIGQETLNALRNCNSIDAINLVLLKLGQSLGTEYFQTIPGPANPFEDVNFLTQLGNFPQELQKIYAQTTVQNADPTYMAALELAAPIKWREIFLKSKSQLHRNFINTLRTQNIIDGISIPIHGPNGCIAILMFASQKILGKNWDDADSLSLIAVALTQRIKRIMAAKLLPQKCEVVLTIRESECLAWVLDGKTNWEIGVLVGITARTVQFHIANCARKLGVSNRIQAAIKALTSGMITIPNSEIKGQFGHQYHAIDFPPPSEIMNWQITNNPSEKTHA